MRFSQLALILLLSLAAYGSNSDSKSHPLPETPVDKVRVWYQKGQLDKVEFFLESQDRKSISLMLQAIAQEIQTPFLQNDEKRHELYKNLWVLVSQYRK